MYSDDSDDERRESVLSTGHRGSIAMGNRQSKRQSYMNRESHQGNNHKKNKESINDDGDVQ